MRVFFNKVHFFSSDTILLTKESNARFGQQPYFFIENQHVRPSPLLLASVEKQPSGHVLPIKQNGAIPYHLHKAIDGVGVAIKRRIKTQLIRNNIDKAI